MTKHATQYDEDKAALAKAKADMLAEQEREADEYGTKMIEEGAAEQAEAEPEPEPERFKTGGAPYDEIAAWREAHGTAADPNVYEPGQSTPTVEPVAADEDCDPPVWP